ncbi:type I polyketide synthase [Frankia sp. R82]|uniref:type I polyketide synthase n=1 Tax=Frankia sp. R82 TaxID=2950553 RepID=UPI002042F90F|nr:type I polyketide synthase [Frankia sp. R82]MCM3887454.1 acyltransferase domain-containing protein [Frankia sp. R82]
MSPDTAQYVEALRQALREVERLRRELAGIRDAAAEPIAVIGMSCRFPGGSDSPERLWELLDQGHDAIGPFPDDRGWPSGGNDAEPSQAEAGGFLPGAAGFDADFFGISPREALAMDPQQRLLLELAWTALEQAGTDPDSLRGTETGVYVGMNGQDYPLLFAAEPSEAAGFLLTGNAASVASGRVSYTLGLTGPSVTVDTACSSALVAVHHAMRALRAREVPLALVGAATVMSTPAAFTEFARQRGLASDGRCKAFGEAADGVGWGEGGAFVVLERLRDARAYGHSVLAVLRGAAVNSDGASNGLTAPNGPAQERVLRRALADAGLEPADLDAIEAHGTGTRLGDPIEAAAILAVHGRARGRPLWLGSVKSNLGHTQAAAGLAGLLKLVLALRHGRLPRTLHAVPPTAAVAWDSTPVRLLTESQPWPAGDRPRRAGVSAFGISGTNAHVIVEEAPPAATPEAELAPLLRSPCLLSARSPAALREQAERLAALVRADPAITPARLGLALATGRAALRHRAAITAADRAGLLAGLDDLATGGAPTGATVGVAGDGDLAVVFTGQGAQRVAMGLTLADHFPTFAERFAEVCAALDPLLDRPLRDVIANGEGLDDTAMAQPALFAVEVALFGLLESFGLAPAAVAGHSVGELAAVHVAGALPLREAARVVCARGRAMSALPPGGAMLAVAASEAQVEPLLGGDLDLAAVNGPHSVVLAGRSAAIEHAARLLAAGGTRCRRLVVSHAFHSRLVEPALAELAAVVSGVRFAAPRIPVVSTATGQPLTGSVLASPDYWTTQARRPVRFLDAVRALERRGSTTILEVGPTPALTAAVTECLADPSVVSAIPTLRPDLDDPDAFCAALGALLVRGDLERAAVFAGARAAPVDLPTYPFQHTRFWPSIRRAASPPEQSGDGPVAEESIAAGGPGQRGSVLDLVLGHVASVLGHPAGSVDPHRTLAELGLTSLSAAELRERLAAASGLRLSTADLLTAGTPHELAASLVRGEDRTPDGELRSAFARACATGDVRAGLVLLADAADAAGVGDAAGVAAAAATAARPRPPLVFAEGDGPLLVCLPSMVAPSSPYQFARLLGALDQPASVAWLTGYRPGETPPSTWRAAVAGQVDAMLKHVGDRPFVLLGYSSGGWLAHAAAPALLERGAALAAVVLLDVHPTDGSWAATTMRELFRRMAADPTVADLVSDGELRAMGRYLSLAADWRPAPLPVPVVHLRAAADPGEREPQWGVVSWRTVPGDHLSVLREDAASTAVALASCMHSSITLTSTPTGRHP